MKDQIIKYETALFAKEKGFFTWCQYRYRYSGEVGKLEPSPFLKLVPDSKQIFAPTQSLLQKWLREVHEIFIFVNFYGKNIFWIEILNSKGNMIYDKSQDKDYDSYEEALENGLLEGLKLIK